MYRSHICATTTDNNRCRRTYYTYIVQLPGRLDALLYPYSFIALCAVGLSAHTSASVWQPPEGRDPQRGSYHQGCRGTCGTRASGHRAKGAMPLQQGQSLAAQAAKAYKELLRKIAHNRDHSAGSAENYLPSTAAVQQHTYYILAEFEQQRVRAEASFDRSFERLKQLASFDADAARASYHASKQRAKQRLRQALDAKVAKYMGPPRAEAAATSTTTAQNLGVASTSSPTAAGVSDLGALYGSYGYLRSMVLYLVGHASRAYMTSLNTTTVEGLGQVEAALQRPKGQALITVSNHVAALDDPLIVSALLPQQALQQPEALRWTLCATDRCFKYAAAVPFFRAAKVLPVARGGGMAQPGMLAAEERLAVGEWVHIFPEGTRSRDGKSLGPVRKGVGRLVASCPMPPLVVPFVHSGMENIMPRGTMVPAVGQQVRVVVGSPIPVEDLLARAHAEGWAEDRLHVAIASRVSTHLTALKARLDSGPSAVALPCGAAPAAHEAGGEVSSLDLFDPQDVLPRRGGRISAAWERVKFKMQHRTWLGQQPLMAALPAASPACSSPPVAAAGGATAFGGQPGRAGARALGGGGFAAWQWGALL